MVAGARRKFEGERYPFAPAREALAKLNPKPKPEPPLPKPYVPSQLMQRKKRR